MTNPREDRAALWLVVTSHAVQHVYIAGLAVTYPLVVSSFHISYSTLGVVLTVASLIGGLLQAAAGFVRHVSARTILAIQNIGLSVTCAMAALVPGFALFGLARCLGALVSWPQHPVGSAYLAERFPVRRGAVLSWHTAGGSLGTVVVPLFASWLITVAGWRWALMGMAIPLVAVGALVLTKLPSDNYPAPSGGTGNVDITSQSGVVPLRKVLRHPRVMLILAASTVAAGGRGLGTISTYMPAYLKSGLDLGQYQVGSIFTIVLGASVIGPVVIGYLADRLGRIRLVIASYVGGAMALLSFVLVGSNLLGLVGTGLLVGVLAYAESPLLQAVFADAARDADQRTAFGLYFAIAYGVGALWLALFGWMIDVVGFRAVFFTMAISFVAAGGLVAAAARTNQPTSLGTHG